MCGEEKKVIVFKESHFSYVIVISAIDGTDNHFLVYDHEIYQRHLVRTRYLNFCQYIALLQLSNQLTCVI